MLAYLCYLTGKSVHKMEVQMKEMKEMKSEVEKMVANTRYVWKHTNTVYHACTHSYTYDLSLPSNSQALQNLQTEVEGKLVGLERAVLDTR